jgi:hypothetical protein
MRIDPFVEDLLKEIRATKIDLFNKIFEFFINFIRRKFQSTTTYQNKAYQDYQLESSNFTFYFNFIYDFMKFNIDN